MKLEIQTAVNTDSFQLKLRAIAKHASALADELEKIGGVTCNKCGGLMEVCEFYSGYGVERTTFECKQCGESKD